MKKLEQPWRRPRMAMSNTKPLDFWLDLHNKDQHGWMDAIYIEGDKDIYPNWIRVIEYSAYQSALEEIEALKAKVARYEKVLVERCCIDDCGFDVENEPIEVLRDCMKAIDFEARQALGDE